MDIKIGDIVGRKSYGCDIAFRVHDILKQQNNYIIILTGINMRLIADSKEEDLIKLPQNKINEMNLSFERKFEKKIARANKAQNKKTNESIAAVFSNKGNIKREDTKFKRPGRILHLDSDEGYLAMCLKAYKEFEIDAVGKLVTEAEQPKQTVELLKLHKPDILVLTGHDSMLSSNNTKNVKDGINNYRNSKYFIEAVKEARKYEKSLDELIIFAGACQSMFEGIIEAGANFASSPGRILIHALDPAMACQKIALTSIKDMIPAKDLISGTISGIAGIGGVDTMGKYREGMPKITLGSV